MPRRKIIRSIEEEEEYQCNKRKKGQNSKLNVEKKSEYLKKMK